jgi:hypothetical protein
MLDGLVALIADRFGVSPDDLKRKSQGQARKALAHLASDDGGLTLLAIGSWMGVSERAASKMRQGAMVLYATDRGYREKVNQIREALSSVSRCDPNFPTSLP